jgi:hypothetical protein
MNDIVFTEVKSIFASKTFWLNVLGPVFAFLATKYGLNIDADSQMQIVLAVMAIANIIVTKESNMTSIFVKIEQAVVTDVSTAVADLEQFFTADVWPIMQAVFTYIENNAGSDLLNIASNALSAALSGIEGGAPVASVASAVVGTVLSEAQSAGLQVAEGAATLAVSMAAAQVNQAAATGAPASPPASTDQAAS